ncbi:tectonin beta-propeller repeat-containing protein 1-like [Acanthaster planci]|uniref:Tectonin beta-propeller repeat-containing protein 1-like n=1 Tax=Acanthaster planci TaxID=133434 RepID=A0A8B7XHB7_ACAPL|nr:tectonin beta-propeller repeat-containing protein 1-like [Acanthaster planci]
MAFVCWKRMLILLVAIGILMAHCQRLEDSLAEEETQQIERNSREIDDDASADGLAVSDYWTKIGGSMIRPSVGRCGVWGVNIFFSVYYRRNTYDNPKSLGDGWLGVLNDKPIKIRQVSVGYNTVWALDQYYKPYYREGITASEPTGTKWVKLSDKTRVKYISVTQKGHVWGLSERDEPIFRKGASNTNIAGSEWQKVPGSRMQSIKAGEAGVWGINWGLPENNQLWYRKGTYGDPDTNTIGSEWLAVGGVFSYISVGDQRVYGTNYTSEIFYRSGISATVPTGDKWVETDTGVRGLSELAYLKDTLWAIDYNRAILAKIVT